MTEERAIKIAELLRQANEMLSDMPTPEPLTEAEWDARCKNIEITSMHLADIFSRTGAIPTPADYFAEFGSPEKLN